MPPSESIKLRRAMSVLVPVCSASRAMRPSAAVVWMNTGATEFTRMPLMSAWTNDVTV